MNRAQLVDAVETYQAHLTLGCEVETNAVGRMISQSFAPLVYDANHLQVHDNAITTAVLAFLDSQFASLPCRSILTTPDTDPSLIAQLTLENYEPDPTLQLILTGGLLGPPPGALDIRPLDIESDWAAFARLWRADHQEKNDRAVNANLSQAYTNQVMIVQRVAARAAHFSMAWVDDAPVAFFSSWPGRNGTGMIEDLFTLPDYRHCGIARALIHHCVQESRDGGAGPILIGAFVDDTPKQFYAALGFEPAFVTTMWHREHRSLNLRNSGASS